MLGQASTARREEIKEVSASIRGKARGV